MAAMPDPADPAAPSPDLAARPSCKRLIAFAAWLCVAIAPPAAVADQPAVGAAEPASPASWYGEGVRPTEPQTPQQEAAGFHLPPGFEIRLFAAEPQIAKPMNLAFDARGRLWVTQSEEYPYPAADGIKPRDQIRVLEDTAGDGSADRVTCFADGLNIPIGVLPYGDGCICFSIPNLWYLRDTDGDGRCDKREKILGPFDTSRDTHGMVNSLRRGADGWIYACHGFNNQSTVTGGDGHTIQMASGNTFRFRPDGSRVEHYTLGQVNPFGMTFDEWGNAYTADCHSKPITQLIRGGSYPSFGRPHDGLGFVPPMLDHLHGSTAIAGLAYLPPGGSPSALAGDFLSGNVMTSRINRNRLVWQGATARGQQQPDFLTSDDPWFRPVDLRWGPDGHLYVADFYNKIIGHYEVPLEHPGRDRFRGRIWQIRQVADAETTAASPRATDADVHAAAPQQLVATLDGANPTRFALVVDRLSDDVDAVSNDGLRAIAADPPNANAAVAALWALQRRDALDEALLCTSLERDDPLVRVHALKIVAERGESLTDSGQSQRQSRALVAGLLNSDHPQVARAAAEALGRRPQSTDLAPLLRRIRETAADDPILRQTARIAVRNLLTEPQSAPAAFAQLRRQLSSADPDSAALQQVASIMLGVPTATSAAFLLDYLQRRPDATEAPALLTHAVRHAAAEDQPRCVELARRRAGDDRTEQAQLIERLFAAAGGQPQQAAEPLRRWADEYLATELDALRAAQKDAARRTPIGWIATPGPDWPTVHQQRTHSWPKGLRSSLALGETYTGIRRSDRFEPPSRIAFWIAGHNGPPATPDARQNQVRLVDAQSGAVLRTAYPPRHDQAVRLEWSLAEVTAAEVQIEVVDNHAGTAYAWIAVGGFDPPWLEAAADSERLQATLDAIVAYDLVGLRDEVVQLAAAGPMTQSRRLLIAARLAQLDRAWVLRGLAEVARQQSLDSAVADQVVQAAVERRPVEDELLRDVCSRLALDGQRLLASLWSQNDAGASALLQAIDSGAIAPDVLRDKVVDQRLQAIALSEAQLARLNELRSLAAVSDQQLLAQIAALLASPPAQPDADRGRVIFQKQCAVCHQLAGQGSLVGPQLDGVGSRNSGRLLEDILAPDRNVDRAFRTSTILTDDGRVIVGLVGTEAAGQLPVVGTDGKTQQVAIEAIEARNENASSLMPGNFGELLTADQLHDLLHYLQSLPAVP